ncbi:MAG: response regulator transcription factor [Erysipelotrichaceae bacterium]|nr:response regulator transcription factor [Erysipelotrichaceae bacterium]
MSIVMAMNMGGDDFINKPFDLHILTSKVQAVMRRTYTFSKQLSIITYKDLILNVLDATISYHNISIELTRNELKIMQLLINKHETYVSRDELMMTLWQSDQFIDDNTLSVNMNRLRKKLEILNIYNLITTKKGLGYMLSYD